tara:strand:- start:8 stop:4285 length:4278 start_codon:yes stop_codon:yes gene_type:complete
MAYNPCTPSTVFGSFNHTLFLGCSIVEFSVSMGWNEQVSELTVALVQDDCVAPEASPKHFYNASLSESTTLEADPGFFGEQYDIVGLPVYFRAGEFEFSGIVQSWEKNTSSSSNPAYAVKVASPLLLLSNAELIIGDYSGPVAGGSFFGITDAIYNVFNVYGFLESFGESCPQISQTSEGFYEGGDKGDSGPDGAVFGTDSLGYGGSDANENGLQWSAIQDALRVLISSVPTYKDNFSPYGRIVYRGLALSSLPSPWSNGYGIMPADSFVLDGNRSEYFIDLSEMPSTPSYFRFDGTHVNLMEVISRVCSESGYDFYVELLPIKTSSVVSGSGIAKIIKIRTVSRVGQPSLNAIASFNTAAQDAGTYLSGTIGRELRNELTSTFLAGGQKQTIYQAVQNEDENLILPFFGFNLSGDMIVPTLNASGWWQFEVETLNLNGTLKGIELPSTVTITEKELMSAREGYDNWERWAPIYSDFEATGTDLWIASEQEFTVGGLNMKLGLSYYTEQAKIAEAAKEACIAKEIAAGETLKFAEWWCKIAHCQSRDMIHGNTALSRLNSKVHVQQTDDKKAIHAWINTFANDYYGQKYAVAVPNTCVKFDEESQKVSFSETPINQGWTEMPSVIGLTNPSPDLNFFRDDDNTIGAFVGLSGAGLTGNGEGVDVAHMNEDNFLIPSFESTGTVYVKATVEDQYAFHDSANYLTPRVVVTLSEDTPVTDDLHRDTAGGGHIAKLEGRIPPEHQPRFNAMGHQIGGKFTHLPRAARSRMPHLICFGMQSNGLTYGPWWNRGPAGQTRIEQQQGLVPWQYGSVADMDEAAQALATEGITNMQVGEMGSVTLAGYPTLPLGAELNSGPALAGKHLIENRDIAFIGYNNTLHNGDPFSATIGFYSFGFLQTGTYGPNITGMSISVGAGGMQTTYRMRTFTPKFGTFTQLNANRLKQIGQNKMKNAREMKTLVLQQSIRGRIGGAKAGRQSAVLTGMRRAMPPQIFWGRSPHEILMAENVSFRGRTRSIVATSSLSELPIQFEQNYEHKAFMSLDGLIRPVSMDGTGMLSRYYVSSDTTNSSRGSLGPMLEGSGTGVPGAADSYVGDTPEQSITLDDLNPFSNPTALNRSKVVQDKHKDQGEIGHDIDILGRGDTVPDSGIILTHNASGPGGIVGDYTDDYRALALRGPVLIQQWGYDLDGKPVPNKIDKTAAARSGVFESSGLQSNFMSGWLQRSESWPVAPIDLRLDRDRGVWVSPPRKEKLVVIFDEDIDSNSSGKASFPSGENYPVTGYTDSGVLISEPTFEAHDILGNSYSSGDKAIIDYNETKKRWEILLSDPAQGEWAECVTTISACQKFDTGRRVPGFGTVDLIERYGGNSRDGGESTGGTDIAPSGTESGNWYETGIQVTAFNMVQSTIAAGKDVQIKRIGGYRFIDVEDCS